MNTKISVFCLWRDSEQTAYKTLKQLENLESIEGFEFSYFFMRMTLRTKLQIF